MIHTIDCAELDKAHDMDDWLDVGWGQGASDMGLSVARVHGAGEERAGQPGHGA